MLGSSSGGGAVPPALPDGEPVKSVDGPVNSVDEPVKSASEPVKMGDEPVKPESG